MADGAPNDDTIEFEYTFKLIAVGDASVGKTSILNRFTNDEFEDSYKTTLGVDFKIRTIDLDAKRRVKIQVWDTAGQERWAALTTNFFRGAHGILVVFDLSSRSTFDHVTRWFDHAQWRWDRDEGRFVGPLPFTKLVLIGNKVDKANERKVTKSEAEELAKEYEVEYVETSAKSGERVLDTFIQLAKELFSGQQRFDEEEAKRQDELIKVAKRHGKSVFDKEDDEKSVKKGCCN